MIEAVAERLEGAPRQLRGRWSDEFKAWAVAEALEPGASVSAIAHWLGIHPSQLFGWRRAVLDARRVPRNRRVVRVATASAGEAVIEIVIGDVIVRARADVSEEHLHRVIRAVRSS